MTPVLNLNFKGNVDAVPGTVLGPRLDGRYVEVLGGYYNAETDKTAVQVEIIDE